MNKRSILLSLIAVAALGCGSMTSFHSTWKNPDAQPLQLNGRKVVTVFISRDPLLRRHAEEAMARELASRGSDAVPSYTFLSDSDVRDRDLARARAESRGFNAAIVMRVVGQETYYTRVPGNVIWVGPTYRRFWGGYWGWGWGTVWDPGYLSLDRVVKVETLVYSLEQDQLIWAGESRTFDPGRIDAFVEELTSAVCNRMTRAGLFLRV